jgi:hypothetical protein
VRVAGMHHVPAQHWLVQAVNPHQADLCLIGRLDPDGGTFKDYLLDADAVLTAAKVPCQRRTGPRNGPLPLRPPQ